ncbi:hypothetical protein HPB50_003890 [Hyalomma asiaticum]|uniref:Uncharacterized protein n=1 Tax=Hyalomma asiaticum TaxID=266040 RepID=A0ACB7RU22_HYAAI|nr:hypothetical protein HPB50_003890 [Hyalomma asiaticum]
MHIPGALSSQQALVNLRDEDVPSSYRSASERLGSHKRTVIAFCIAAAVLALQVTLILALFRPSRAHPEETVSWENVLEKRARAAKRYAGGRVGAVPSRVPRGHESQFVDRGPATLPSGGRQLWCVYEPGKRGYQLRDVPVPLCTVVLYCCVEPTARGVRYRGVDDEGSDGVDAFAGTLRRGHSNLPLYALFGDGVQTTAVFCNQARQVRGATASELSALTTTWLQSKQLDGFLFFYRSHSSVTVSDAEFLGHFRRLREDLELVGLFVSAVVSFHKDQANGPLSISNVLSLVQDVVVLRMHDLSPAPVEAAACSMPFELGGVTRAPSISRLLADMNDALPDFERSLAPRLLFSVTCEATSYFLNSSSAFHEGDPAVKIATGSTYWQMCEMAAKLGYEHHYSLHGDCHVVHKDRFWQAGLGPNSTRLFGATSRFAGAVLFAMHADDARGRCGQPHGLTNHVRRSLDRFAAPHVAGRDE